MRCELLHLLQLLRAVTVACDRLVGTFSRLSVQRRHEAEQLLTAADAIGVKVNSARERARVHLLLRAAARASQSYNHNQILLVGP